MAGRRNPAALYVIEENLRDKIEFEWTERMENIFGSIKGYQLFLDFLKTQTVQENGKRVTADRYLLFWTAIEGLKKGDNIPARSDEIIKLFISQNAQLKITISTEARQSIQHHIQMIEDAEVFGRAQNEVARRLQFDFHKNFLESAVFKDYLDTL